MINTNVEYIWLDNDNNFRSKTKIITNKLVTSLTSLPLWNYHGSSCGQANTETSEIILKPVFICNDPFRGQNHRLAYCVTYTGEEMIPLNNNYREYAEKIFKEDKVNYFKPWFGMEQEFFIMNPETGMPFKYNHSNTQGKYYCGVGTCQKVERDIMEDFIKRSYDAGLKVCGINEEVAQGQWEYQIGPLTGILAADQLMMSRYILVRIAENYNANINFHPKPLWDWNGSGCHTNYSTKFTRNGTNEHNGIYYINAYINRLKTHHLECMQKYGINNHLRMTGTCETANYNHFTHSVGGRNCSIRIGYDVARWECGYFEDRRPASNCDPYLVTSSLFLYSCANYDQVIEQQTPRPTRRQIAQENITRVTSTRTHEDMNMDSDDEEENNEIMNNVIDVINTIGNRLDV